MHIAEAHLAYIATERNIDKYYLIKVLGKGEDTNTDYSYSNEEKERHDNYRSAATLNKIGILRYKINNIDFTVEISETNVARILAAKNNTIAPKGKSAPTLIKPKNVDRKMLEIASPKGTKAKPQKIDSELSKVSWRCMGCSEDTSYTVRLTDLDKSKKFKPYKTKNKQQALKLEPGNYKVIVSGDGAASNPQFFTVNTGGGLGIFLLLLLLAALAAVGYFVWKNFSKSQKGGGNIGESKQDNMFPDGSGKRSKSETLAGSVDRPTQIDDGTIDDF
jgi:hypothetical protein